MKAFVQLALDWLENQAKPHQPLSGSDHTDTGQTQALTPLSELTTIFQHPRANRHIHFSVGSAAYCLTRSKRKTIGMSVGPDGLDVRAPRWASIGVIESALHEKADWILRKLQEMQERQRRMQSTAIEWRDGSSFPFMGQTVLVQLDATHQFKDTGARLEQVVQQEGLVVQQVLKVSVSQQASPAQIRDAVQAWLMQQAKVFFIQRLDFFAPALGVQWKKMSLSNAGTRWGSAAADGSIRLNWRLIHFKPEIIDYVVVHELSHLRVMDHSPLFWETVRHVVPDYALRRAQLRDEALPQWA